MKRYKLIKDLPTFRAGDEFVIGEDGCLWLAGNSDGQYCGMSMTGHWKKNVMAYHKNTLKHFSNILEDWFEEIEDVGGWMPKYKDRYWYILDSGSTGETTWLGWCSDEFRASIGNVFRNEEEVEKAVEKLKAWKRLRDKGFKFEGWEDLQAEMDFDNLMLFNRDVINTNSVIGFRMNDYHDCIKDLDLLFGGEE